MRLYSFTFSNVDDPRDYQTGEVEARDLRTAALYANLFVNRGWNGQMELVEIHAVTPAEAAKAEKKAA